MKRIVPLIVAMLLAGCGTFGQKGEQNEQASAEKIYREAKSELDSGNYQTAAKLYESLTARIPYGSNAQHAEIEKA